MRDAVISVAAILLLVGAYLLFLGGDRFPGARESMLAVETVIGLNAAENDYFCAHGRFGSLAELDSDGELRAGSAGYEFRLFKTMAGYAVVAWPATDMGHYAHSIFSDHTGIIRLHFGPGRANSHSLAMNDDPPKTNVRCPGLSPFESDIVSEL